MKTIGLIGGMSWESTAEYYRAINEGVKERLGGMHSAQIILHSVDFAPIERMMNSDDWDGIAGILATAAVNVQNAGADCLLLCSNTVHKVAERVQDAVHIPLLHIADATAEALREPKVKTVGLLGTAYTMEQKFYKGRLTDRYGLSVVAPDREDRKVLNQIIFQELCLGVVRDESKKACLEIIDKLRLRGAQGVILGCTELGMLVRPEETEMRLFDTTVIHAQKAVAYAI